MPSVKWADRHVEASGVYESMLPRQPLRFVLPDDPGAGKTIMAGLLIRELLMRADAKRVLIIAPGSLVEQWQDEMFEKFGIEFTVFSRELDQTSRSGNAFEENDLLIARLDQLSRNEMLQEKLTHTDWDMVITARKRNRSVPPPPCFLGKSWGFAPHPTGKGPVPSQTHPVDFF